MKIRPTTTSISVAVCLQLGGQMNIVGAQQQHDLELADKLSDALATLDALGIQGINGLCHPVASELYSIPRCKDILDVPNSLHYLRRRELGEEHADTVKDARFYIFNIGGAFLSIAFVAIIAAMFLGFLTLDPLAIQVKMRAATDPEEREAAADVYELVKQSHRLLVTLLLMNALAYECLPLFLDNLMPTYMTILFSVSLLLIFGEIIPSAIFIGPDQLVLASRLAPLVSFSLTMLHPVSYPLVKLLDWLVPEETTEEEYNRAELAALVRIQYEERMKEQRQLEGKTKTGVRMLVPHMANQINAEKQRSQQYEDVGNFNSNRNWRNLKEEIMHAVAERNESSDEQQGGIFDGLNIIGGNTDTDAEDNSVTVGSRHRRNPSNSSVSVSAAPDYEQMAPPMHHTEIKAVEGALKLKTGCTFDIYTPLRKLFAVPSDMILTKEAMAELYGQGYSRVPVYERQPPPNEHRISRVKGVLMTRQLIMIDWDDERTVDSLPLYIPPCVSPRMNLVTLLGLLRKGGSLVAFVCAGPHLAKKALREGRAVPIEAGFMGIVTLQDVLESVIQERIYDEEDIAERNMASAVLTRWAANKISRFIKEKRKLIKRRTSDAENAGKDSISVGKGSADDVANEKSPLIPKV